MNDGTRLAGPEDRAAQPQPGAGSGDRSFLAFLTIIFAAGAAIVLAVGLNMGSPAVAGTSDKAAVSTAQPPETERFVPFHERYGFQAGEPEYQPPTF